MPQINSQHVSLAKKRMKKLSWLVLLLTTVATLSSSAQELTIPAASPTEKISQQFGLSKIEISYSRPGVKDRVVFGGLVPYGEIWRTGANASTKIYFKDDVMLEGRDVPAGKYALYTIPAKDQWTIIISKDTTLWGSSDYKQETDLLRFTVKPMTVPMLIENFTIDINNIKPTSCDINLLWEKTMVTLHVTQEIDSKIMAQIDVAMKGEKPPYWQAANYYFENGKDINQAYVWVNKALEARPDAYYMMTTKAKMELKMGKNKEAIATATKAIELAQKENEPNYVEQNKKTIDAAKMR
jgi:hypothetical protein